MNIESYLTTSVLPHISSEKKREFIKALILDCINIPAASVRVGISRQRGHVLCNEFIEQVVPHLDVQFVKDKVTKDLYHNPIPWITLLSLMEHNQHWLSYILYNGFIVKRSITDKIIEIVADIRHRTALHSVVDITDIVKMHPKRSAINCDNDTLIDYIKASIANSCPTSILHKDGRDYLLKVRQHDVNRVLKMIHVSPEHKVAINALYEGYVKHLNFIGSPHVMTEHEHRIFCTEISKQEAFKDVKQKFYYEDGFVYAHKQNESPLSSTESAVYNFFVKRFKATGDPIISSSDIQDAVSKEMSIASIRKTLGASCIVVRESHGFYSLFGAT